MSDTNMLGVGFYIASFLISLTCIVYTLIQKRTDKLQKKLYILMVAIIAFNDVTELIVTIMNPRLVENPGLIGLVSAANFFYFLTHTSMLAMLGYYVLSLTGRLSTLTRAKNAAFLAPVIFIELLLLTNPIHQFCYHYVSGTLKYERGVGVTILYFISAFYILFFFGNLFISNC